MSIWKLQVHTSIQIKHKNIIAKNHSYDVKTLIYLPTYYSEANSSRNLQYVTLVIYIS